MGSVRKATLADLSRFYMENRFLCESRLKAFVPQGDVKQGLQALAIVSDPMLVAEHDGKLVWIAGARRWMDQPRNALGWAVINNMAAPPHVIARLARQGVSWMGMSAEKFCAIFNEKDSGHWMEFLGFTQVAERGNGDVAGEWKPQ